MFQSMAITNMDTTQAEKFLEAQSKKKDNTLTHAQIQLFLKFWNTHRNDIHDYVRKDCQWDPQLTNMNWRVDTVGRSQYGDVNEPRALVEMSLFDFNTKVSWLLYLCRIILMIQRQDIF